MSQTAPNPEKDHFQKTPAIDEDGSRNTPCSWATISQHHNSGSDCRRFRETPKPQNAKVSTNRIPPVFIRGLLANGIVPRLVATLHERARQPLLIVPKTQEGLTHSPAQETHGGFYARHDREATSINRWSGEDRRELCRLWEQPPGMVGRQARRSRLNCLPVVHFPNAWALKSLHVQFDRDRNTEVVRYEFASFLHSQLNTVIQIPLLCHRRRTGVHAVSPTAQCHGRATQP